MSVLLIIIKKKNIIDKYNFYSLENVLKILFVFYVWDGFHYSSKIEYISMKTQESIKEVEETNSRKNIRPMKKHWNNKYKEKIISN